MKTRLLWTYGHEKPKRDVKQRVCGYASQSPCEAPLRLEDVLVIVKDDATVKFNFRSDANLSELPLIVAN